VMLSIAVRLLLVYSHILANKHQKANKPQKSHSG